VSAHATKANHQERLVPGELAEANANTIHGQM